MVSFARMPPVRWRCLPELLQILRTGAVLQAVKGGSNVPKELPSNVAALLISDERNVQCRSLCRS